MSDSEQNHADSVAIIGLSGRFPGARNIDEFWDNLCEGVESVSFFTDQELLDSGVEPAALKDINYVKAGAVLEGVEMFDAAFFGFNHREAEITDPQHRLFLECAWEVLESAGYDPEKYEGWIGVYGGTSMSTYLLSNLYPHRGQLESLGHYPVYIGNDKDFLATRVSYKLNLKGPSITLQTACSSALVAVHLGCQSLLNYQCDMALAGGVSIHIPQRSGYLYSTGGILSPDGHCRAFDRRAQGTVGGNGVGIILLKRLEDALADGDCIYAVVRGSAINNDGSSKVGYTAPSVDGQAEVIAMAQAVAGIDPETISYIEAHGTGTPLGDPIEVAALTQAFRASTSKKGFCAIGSVKTNIGHLDVAAAIAGMIKTVLSLKHNLLPPSLHFEQPNPAIDFADSPFYVNKRLTKWEASGTPRRAGVSSFGFGGTNAHVILEEAPTLTASGESRPWQLLTLSAMTNTALEMATRNLCEYLKQHRADINLADVAYTYQVGRRAFDYRRVVLCHDLDDATNALESMDSRRVFTNIQKPADRPVVFMFPGQGAQYPNMGLELYQTEPTFREHIDACSQFLKPLLGFDLREALYPIGEQPVEAAQQLKLTAVAQPALFVTEYALAKLWMQWGVHPQSLIGHSVGEYVAACLAGVFTLEEALALIAKRGQLMQKLPGGAMLAVPLSEKEVRPLLGKALSLGAVNGPSLCVLSGSTDAIKEVESLLAESGVGCSRLDTSHAFHSAMMEPVLQEFGEQIGKAALAAPHIPFISNVTGTWIKEEEATNPDYWVRHLRQTVRFAEGIRELLEEPERVLLEVGPGRTLSTLVRRHNDTPSDRVVLSTLHGQQYPQADEASLVTILGRLWLTGVQIDWARFHAHERRLRVPLPTYPFERQRYWIESHGEDPATDTQATSLQRRPAAVDWFYVPSWKQSILPVSFEPLHLPEQQLCWLVFIGEHALGSQLLGRLEQKGVDFILVRPAKQFARVGDHEYTLNPRQSDEYDALFNELRTLDKRPRTIVHLWSVTDERPTTSGAEHFENAQDRGFYSLLYLAQALGKQKITDAIHIAVLSNNVQEVTGEEALLPEKATVLGPCKVIPQEYPNITCRSIDVALPKAGTSWEKKLIDQLINELTTTTRDLLVAYRGNYRWVLDYEPIRLDGGAEVNLMLREGGVYLITGGLGSIGLVLAEYLAQKVQANLILLGRSSFPARAEWQQWLATHDDQDSVSRKIRKIHSIEKQGATVLVIGADVADQEQMREVVSQIEGRFGSLHGVIHAAGITGENSFRAIQETNRGECEQQFRPKIHGLLSLAHVLGEKNLDFCLLFSSLASALGGLGFVTYSAANLFMDAFAYQQNRRQPASWISVDWDSWQLKEAKKQATSYRSIMEEFAIPQEAGLEAFQRILSIGSATQILISTGDLKVRADHWINHEHLRGTGYSQRAERVSLHVRPDLQEDYVPPANGVEQVIADIWQELLGIDRVGTHDSFFDLGGHSLLATQLVARVRKTFQIDLPLRSFFENSTIAEIAVVIENMLIEEIEGLSEDEVQRLIERTHS